MNAAIKRTLTISKIRWQSLYKNYTLVFFPLIAIGYVVIFKSIIANLHGRGPAVVWILSMAVLFNVAMCGIMFSVVPIAEEKEQHTLQVLLDSKVTGVEYLIGSLIPVLLIIVITNLILVLVSGISFNQINLGIYLLFSFIGALTSIFIGNIFVIVAPNQKAAGFYTLPAMFILAIIPMFKAFSPVALKITDLCYTGIINNFIIKSVVVGSYQWNFYDLGILLAWLVISFLILVGVYKKMGLGR